MIKKLKNFFWLSLLLHILLFLSFSFVVSSKNFEVYQPFDPSLQKKAFTVLPAYLFKGEKITPVKTENPSPNSPMQDKAITKNVITSKNGIEKPKNSETQKMHSSQPRQLKTADYSAQMNTESSTAEKSAEDPLLRLLYNATARSLVYPRAARDFRVAATVRVKFLVYPNGMLTNVTLEKSSGFGYYDDAVIAAINTMSPVKGVSAYLSKPKYVTAIIHFS